MGRSLQGGDRPRLGLADAVQLYADDRRRAARLPTWRLRRLARQEVAPGRDAEQVRLRAVRDELADRGRTR